MNKEMIGKNQKRSTHRNYKVELFCDSQISSLTDDQEIVVKTAQFAMEYFELPISLVSIAIVDIDRIHQLNLQFRNMNKPTDVLSFAAQEGEAIVQNGKRLFLGDIVICMSVAQNQATQYGHSVKRELAFLTIHGMLHLLGYDHMNLEEEKEMFALQKEILDLMGCFR